MRNNLNVMFMKKIYPLMLICSLLFSFGCNEGDPAPPSLNLNSFEVQINDVETGEDFISANFVPSDEDIPYFAGIVYITDINGLDDEAVINNEIQKSGFEDAIKSGTRKLSFPVPSEDATYKFIAFGYLDGKTGKLYQSDDIIIESPYDELLEATWCDIDYYGIFHPEIGSYSWTIRLGRDSHNGMYLVGAGKIYHLSVYNSSLTYPDNPLIPAIGHYWFDTKQTGGDMAIDSIESLMTEQKTEEEESIEYHYYEDCSLDISILGDGTYKFVANVVMAKDDGDYASKRIRIVYQGPVTFNDCHPKWNGPVLQKDVEFTADYAGGLQLSDDGVLRFKLNDGGDPFYASMPDKCPNRIWLEFPGQTSEVLPTGTFSVDYSGEKGTALAGQFHYIGNGVGENIGTYYFSIDRSYIQTIGYVVSGTINVSINDDTHYVIQADLQTDLGHSIKMTYVDEEDLLKRDY